jgi:hypothetical protein
MADEQQQDLDLHGKRIFLTKRDIFALGGPTELIPPDVYSVSEGDETTIFMESPTRTWLVDLEYFREMCHRGDSIHILDQKIGKYTRQQEKGFFPEKPGSWPPSKYEVPKSFS